MNILLILFVSCGFSFLKVLGKKVPVFNTYTVSGAIFVPHAEVEEPFTAWYDATSNKSRIDYYKGMVKTYQNALGMIKVVPVTTENIANIDRCFILSGTLNDHKEVQPVIPDLSNFKFVGNKIIRGENCDVWVNKTEDNHIETISTIYLKWQRNYKTNEKEPVPVMYKNGKFYFLYSNFNSESPDPSEFIVPNNSSCVSIDKYKSENHHYYVNLFNPMREFINNDVRHVDYAWSEFHKQHGREKEYKSDMEHKFRKNIFHQNLRFIQSANRANLGFSLAVNHLADRTSEELNNLHGLKGNDFGLNGTKPFPYSDDYLANNEDELPDNFDWRLFGAVTPVKDQLRCGSCWSFAATGAVEGAYFLKNGYRIRLSEQALIDCSWGFHNSGCDGGLAWKAFGWIEKHGIPKDSVYGPYLDNDGYCHIENMTMAAHITGFVQVVENNELALKTALVKHGPIAISIDANSRYFSFYSSGVYYRENCQNCYLNHAVLLVGYGDLNGEPYWLVKNSWSDRWGNDGYILMSRKSNNCGVMSYPFYVTM